MSTGTPNKSGSGQTETTVTVASTDLSGARKIRLKRTDSAYVVCYKKVGDGGGGRKYSRDLKDVQKMERGFTSAARRVSDAMARGLKTYQKNRNKSARKKKDGAVEDAFENWSKGFGTFLRNASDAPLDITRKLNRKRFKRGFRNMLRMKVPRFFM